MQADCLASKDVTAKVSHGLAAAFDFLLSRRRQKVSG